MRLCALCCFFSWLCSAACATLLLCAGSSTAESQSSNIWALASKDASWRCPPMWRCASNLCCSKAVRSWLQGEAAYTLLCIQDCAAAG